MKKLSIIVPVYGVEKYIGKCLDSLVNQTLKEIEIIVVNDGSLDNSQKIIDEYVEKYPHKVKSFVKENGGQGSARNFGIKKATGKYIGFVDGDDYVDLEMFEKLYNKSKESDYDIVTCNDVNITEDGKIININKQVNSDKKEDMFFGIIGVCNKIYKKDLIIENKIYFREKVRYEDVDFTIKCIMNANKIANIDEELYYYLMRNGSTMNNNDAKRNLEIISAFEEIQAYDKNNSYYDEIEYLAIYNIYIAAVVRVINSNVANKEKKEVIAKLINYVENNFSSFKNNKYLYKLDRNKKIIYNLIKIRCFWLVRFIFNIKILKKKKKLLLIILLILSLITITIYVSISNLNKVAVLGYHGVLPRVENTENDNLIVDLEKFDKQLDILDFLGYKTLTLEEFQCWKEKKCKKPHKSVLITFDDGYTNNYEYAFKSLKEHNMNAVVFVVGSYIGESAGMYMSKGMIENMSQNYENIEVASHSYDLHYHSDKTYEEVENDIKHMNNVITSQYYAYPYGDYTDEYIEALKDNDYKLAFTFGPSKEHRKAEIKDDNFKIPRLNISNDMPLYKFILRLNLPL